MTRFATRNCDCPDVVTGTGQKRPETCDCGNRYKTEAELRPAVFDSQEAMRFGPRTYTPGQAKILRETVANRKPISPFEAPPAFFGTFGTAPSTPRRRSSLKRSEPKRDWTLAQAKVEEEDQCCRVCGVPGVEKAHILGRKYDQPISPGSKTLLVLPDRIVPLCGPLENDCHQRYDAHELDLLPHLTTAEQAQAVLDAGSIGLALNRISPQLERLTFREKRETRERQPMSSENLTQGGGERRRRQCSHHDSRRLDGWLDDRCMNCGFGGYWRDGEAIVPSPGTFDTRHHPSGKVLMREREPQS